MQDVTKMNKRKEIKITEKAIDKQALKEAVDATILNMKEIYKKINGGDVREPRYTFCGWAWLLLKKSANKQLFDLFEKYAPEYPHRVDNKKDLYHLTRSDVPLAEETDNTASEQALSSGWCETDKTEKWKNQHFEVRFDFKDNDGNAFCDQSLQYKEEVYGFLFSQLKPFGINAEIKTLAD